MTRSLSSLRRKNNRGVSSVEYIIILVLVAITGIALFKVLGTRIKDKMDKSNTTIDSEVKPL